MNNKQIKRKIYPGSELIYKNPSLAPNKEGYREKSKKNMRTINKSNTPEQLNQRVGMTTLAGTGNPLQLHSDDNLFENIKDSTRLGHIGHPNSSKTWDEDSSATQKSKPQRNPKPVQRITTAMIIEL